MTTQIAFPKHDEIKPLAQARVIPFARALAKPIPVARPAIQGRMVDVLLEHLRAEGIDTVFGIPGGLLHPFFEAIENAPDFTLIVAKHECGAAFMADGYARMTGKPAVVAATSGPGATNLLTGVSVAFSDGVPMIVITGQAPSHTFGKGATQETTPEDIDIVRMFKPVTKYSTMVTAADRISDHLRRALRQVHDGRPGPVHLNIPVDLWSKPVSEGWFAPETYRPASRLFDRDAVAAAGDVLLEAARPLFLVGSGAASEEARARVLALAEGLNARVVTTPRAKGVFPENHPLSLGIFGFAGHPAAKKAMLGADVDVLFAIGSSLNETTTLNWDPGLVRGRKLVQLDVDVDRIGRNYPVDIPLVGDAGTILLELSHHLRRRQGTGAKAKSTWGAAPVVGGLTFDNAERRASESTPLTPERWRAELGAALPDDAVVFSDIGGHMLFNLHHLEIRQGQRFILNLGFGSMGHGTVAPIGAALAAPGRPVVAIVGDACFTMNGMDLLTACEYELPVVWIVEDNQMHGITWHGSKLVGSGKPMDAVVYKHALRIPAIAEAMGLAVWSVSGPGEIAGALSAALASGRPALIHVQVDPSIAPPLGDRAKSVSGFRNG
ncbi:MAG: thiamine pyrophosphate-binding protein [Deltaproteobacteria bacterium]|nr:thiamine pyrophosphate-binding protein [Deltaproteobacteria bacterium]